MSAAWVITKHEALCLLLCHIATARPPDQEQRRKRGWIQTIRFSFLLQSGQIAQQSNEDAVESIANVAVSTYAISLLLLDTLGEQLVDWSCVSSAKTQRAMPIHLAANKASAVVDCLDRTGNSALL